MRVKAPFRITQEYEQRNYPHRVSRKPRIRRVRVTRINGCVLSEEVYRCGHYIRIYPRH